MCGELGMNHWNVCMRVGVFMIQKRKSSILVKKISLVRNQHLLHRMMMMMMMTGYDLYNVTEMCE